MTAYAYDGSGDFMRDHAHQQRARRKQVAIKVGWYIAAKLLEHFDPQIFALTGHVVSGHTLKHVAAAVGVACMVPYMKAGDVGPDRDEKPAAGAQPV